MAKHPMSRRHVFGMPVILLRRNAPMGFADAPFDAGVQDRFPSKNYDGLPLPEEELPLFCYPTGCRLRRALFRDAPLPSSYGFVLKNERGDSIYVACVSFFEPLTQSKVDQLNQLSERRRRTSLPHRRFCERHEKRPLRRRRQTRDGVLQRFGVEDVNDFDERPDFPGAFDGGGYGYDDGGGLLIMDEEDDLVLTSFEEMTTFENKVICLISRYPYWTAFRRFLGNLHLLSGSSSELPLERIISHLLLSVHVPKPGGLDVLVPLTALNAHITLSMPPSKDLPLLDLPFDRLFACLDIPTIVVAVLGFLTLERKVILISTHQSLVLDACELLRALLFPFELCAPYVPRLTAPFISCLEFPGATFVGIYDDGDVNGLAAGVRTNIPEEAVLIDLDTGEVQSSGDRFEVVKQCWTLIPSGPRSSLVSELDALCRDAGISPGQEPLDSQIDDAFSATIPSSMIQTQGYDDAVRYNNSSNNKSNNHYPHRPQCEPIDGRAVRDAFLRFFCSILGGYERSLVVPDADFLISGNEWFDAQGFVSSAPSDFAPYLGSLVSTQLFQSFVQKRTEASDLQCVLFDECLAVYHSAPTPYGRLGADTLEMQSSNQANYNEELNNIGAGQATAVYSLLIDQCAAEPIMMDSTNAISAAATTTTGHLLHSSISREFDDGVSGIEICDSFAESSVVSAGIVHSSSAARSNHTTGFSTPVRSGGGGGGGDTFADSSTSMHSHITHAGVFTSPSRDHLPQNRDARFTYCIDGNPCFPHKLDSALCWPSEPELLASETTTDFVPFLTRSDREIEESNRRRKLSASHRGLHSKRRCLWQLPKLMACHVLGSWLMCIPSQVSQSHVSSEQRDKYLLRALGAMRLLRNRHRVVPDEASYRALMVACGRVDSDRRIEIVKLFGMLRSDDIFPSALTLGQYTKSIAEGFSKSHSNDNNSINNNGGDGGSVATTSTLIMEGQVSSLDTNLSVLEQAGLGWRRSHNKNNRSTSNRPQASSSSNSGNNLNWIPILSSSSFVEGAHNEEESSNHPIIPREDDFRVVALWSKVTSCETCDYIPLDEEIQAGWENNTTTSNGNACSDNHNANENYDNGGMDMNAAAAAIPGAIACPRCGSVTIPMIGYRVMNVSQAITCSGTGECSSSSVPNHSNHSRERLEQIVADSSGPTLHGNVDTAWSSSSVGSFDSSGEAQRHAVPKEIMDPYNNDDIDRDQDNNLDQNISNAATTRNKLDLPAQLIYAKQNSSSDGTATFTEEHGFVPYMDPSTMRCMLEKYMDERGEAGLDRDTMRRLNPRLFFNLWWFSARFSLPLPLLTVQGEARDNISKHYCAFASWDEYVAMKGCASAASVVRELLSLEDFDAAGSNMLLEKIKIGRSPPVLGDIPLLANFNLQTFCQADWENPSLSDALVALVESCDKHDFKPVLDAIMQCNHKNRSKHQLIKSNSHASTAAAGSSIGSPALTDELTSRNDTNSTATMELNCYRTMLYLVRYQCTSAFHRFFPTTAKPCRGYHFWCANGACPHSTFDKMYAKAVAKLQLQMGSHHHKQQLHHHHQCLEAVSDTAVGFRCVFGHII
uniref:UDENN domain-containing protein n=1 Tax=Leptocylindrus danicus TaxID=163516 RepID=A0A7S2PH45_9STRA